MQEHEIESDESLFNPGWFQPKTAQLFHFDSSVSQQFYKEEYVGGVQIQMDDRKHEHKRNIYNVLDLLGDIGGLREALITIGRLLFLVFGQSGLQGFLASQLFWKETLSLQAGDAEQILAS